MGSEDPSLVHVGIDLGETQFQVCVVGEGSSDDEQRGFAHSGHGAAEVIAWLKEKAGGHAERVAVAIETPRGPIVEGLLQVGFAVFSLNPKQLDRFRDRFTLAGSKDDRLDARVLGRSLRTDEWAFRRLRMDPGWLVRMREASRFEDELKEEQRRLVNRLRAVLQRYHAELLALLPSADEPWFWDLVEQAPTPAAGKRLSPRRIKKLLREHRIRRLTADEVVARLREPELPVGPGVSEACSEHALLLVPRLHLLAQQLGRCQAQVQRLLDEIDSGEEPAQTNEHRDVRILRSLPGAGRYVVATMLAEAWRPLENRDYRTLRAVCGAAPVTKQSGRMRFVQMRYACNHRLRHAVHHWAWNAARRDPRAALLYEAMRERGLSHARALRGVADRMLKLATTLLEKGELYDEALRAAA